MSEGRDRPSGGTKPRLDPEERPHEGHRQAHAHPPRRRHVLGKDHKNHDITIDADSGKVLNQHTDHDNNDDHDDNDSDDD
ncbi:hypothetical protein [Streptomyces sp. Isolate_219]|uniref:hypothetical protein n=1 Tax=Streptomyces sp. Isolate_219 TaxID=2950110 RepID=UPI0021C95937|nr:hypothetical protein [Streptomyces sp. Isolate_219]MCR8575857.1 hypothetical protein [Streptomyces sp. Isolate_219]